MWQFSKVVGTKGTSPLPGPLAENEQRSSISSGFDSENYKGETNLLSRGFLEACLEERLAQEEQDPIALDARQREFLEWVATSASFRNAITVPKELLEAFLAAQGNCSVASMDGLRSDERGQPS